MTKRIAKQSSLGFKPVDYTKIKIGEVIDFPGTHWPQLSASKQRGFYSVIITSYDAEHRSAKLQDENQDTSTTREARDAAVWIAGRLVEHARKQ